MIFSFLRVSLAFLQFSGSEWISMCFACVCTEKQDTFSSGLASVKRLKKDLMFTHFYMKTKPQTHSKSNQSCIKAFYRVDIKTKHY